MTLYLLISLSTPLYRYTHTAFLFCFRANGGLNTSTSRSSRFGERTTAGEVVASFGSVDNAVWKGSGQGCSVAPYDSTHVHSEQYMYMFQKLSEKAHGENQNVLFNQFSFQARACFSSVFEYCKLRTY